MNTRRIKLLVALAASCALFASTRAKADTIGLHIVSHHFPARDGQQNFNPGVYWRSEEGLTAGVYRNTLGRTSLYAGLTITAGPFALTTGAATGYRKHADGSGVSKGPLTLMLAPSVALPEVLGVTPRFMVIPRFGAMRSTVLHLALERTF